MRVLFIALHRGYYRNFDSVVRALADGGHEVALASERLGDFGSGELVEALVKECPGVSFQYLPPESEGFARQFAREIRHGISHYRFQQPAYDSAPKMRQLACYRTPSVLAWLYRILGGATSRGAATLDRLLRRLERATPIDRTMLRFIAEQAPDMVWVTPLLGLSERQFDQVRGAQALGIKTVFCVNSWDNLTTGTRVRFAPGRMLLWNEMQKQEAIEQHGIPESRIVVTGAQNFDKWFDRRPRMSREQYCAEVGLDPSKPFILYVCTALLPASPSEVPPIKRWIAALRSSEDPLVREAGILVRPHPQRTGLWMDDDLSEFDNTVLSGSNPVTPGAREDYFLSILHSAAVVGVSSTAMVEAGLLGKSVLTIRFPEAVDTQAGMIHWQYLVELNGGLLYVADELSDHVRQLGERMRAPEPDPKSTRFARDFVRPEGLDQAATPRFMEAVAEYAAAPAEAPVRASATDVALRFLVLYPTRAIAYCAWRSMPLARWGNKRRKRFQKRVKRVRHRFDKLVRYVEKRLMPEAQRFVSALYSRLEGGLAHRLRLLYVRARFGKRRFYADRPDLEALLAQEEKPGTRGPGPFLRWGALYPVVLAGYAARRLGPVRRFAGRVWRLLEHAFRTSRDSLQSTRARLASALRMKWHRTRKRMTWRYVVKRSRGYARHLRRVFGRNPG